MLITDEVDSRHLDADTVGAVNPGSLPVVVLRRRDQGRWQHTVANAVLPTVSVVEERFQGANTLRDSRLHA